MQKKRTLALRTEPGWIAFSLFCGADSDRLEFVDIRQLCALQDVDHEAGGEGKAKLEGFYFGLGQDLVEGVMVFSYCSVCCSDSMAFILLLFLAYRQSFRSMVEPFFTGQSW